MLAVNNNNNVNFQARLDISKLSGNQKRWQNIAKIFEEKTRKSQGSLKLYDGSLDQGMLFTNNNEAFVGVIYGNGAEKLKSLPDTAVAEKLKRIFLVTKKQDWIADKATEFLKKCEYTKQQTKAFMSSVAQVIENKKQSMLSNDRFFNDQNILF